MPENRVRINAFLFSVLAEDAIKAALKDYRLKKDKAAAEN